MLTVLTPTGGRPEAFAECVAQMRAQDFGGPVRWIVVDDCEPVQQVPQVSGWHVIALRPRPAWTRGADTLARNLGYGIDMACTLQAPREELRVVVVEDDDLYDPRYLSACADRLQHDDLVGEAPSLYRHVNGAEKDMGNTGHASLCATAMKGRALDVFRTICAEGGAMLDVRLWRCMPGRIYPPAPRLVTGRKGMPGRPGIGIGHKLAAPV